MQIGYEGETEVLDSRHLVNMANVHARLNGNVQPPHIRMALGSSGEYQQSSGDPYETTASMNPGPQEKKRRTRGERISGEEKRVPSPKMENRKESQCAKKLLRKILSFGQKNTSILFFCPP